MAKRKISYKLIDILILIFSMLLICTFFFGLYNLVFLGIYLLSINIYICYKFRNNKIIFFSFFILLYFNFSFVFSKYFNDTEMLRSLFLQITDKGTYAISILSIIFLFSCINLALDKNKCINLNECDIEINFKYSNLIIYALQFVLILLLLYCCITGIVKALVFVEYSIFLFIICFVFSKNNKISKIITEIIMIGFMFVAFKAGARIAVLQFILADFIINYSGKFKMKTILFFMLLGLVLFTYIGNYRQFLLTTQDYSDLSIKNTLSSLTENGLSLDTSISSYMTTLSVFECASKFSTEERVSDGLGYFIYSFTGNHEYYSNLDYKILRYMINCGGGFPTGYFYYYFEYWGILLISFYIAFILKRIFIKDTMFIKLFRIYVISTIPRWYLYEPTPLIRGAFLFVIFYICLKFIIKIKEKNKNIDLYNKE